MNDKDKNWWKPGLEMFLKVSGSIAVPIVTALFLGKYLDKRYDTAPWIFLGFTFIAFLISLFSIWKNLIGYIRKIEKEEKEKREETK